MSALGWVELGIEALTLIAASVTLVCLLRLLVILKGRE